MSHRHTRGAVVSLLALALVAAVVGLVAQPGQTAQDKQKSARTSLDGTWTAVAMTVGDKKLTTEQIQRLRMTIAGNQVTVSLLRKTTSGTIAVDNAQKPKRFDLKLKGERTNAGIYRLDKDMLTLFFSDGGERPARFDAPPGQKQVFMVLQRETSKPAASKTTKPSSPRPGGAEFTQSQNNLKQMALAMHNYHATYKHLPKPAIYSKDGKPLLSWRVAILPFIEQAQLYREFKLNEPWDSPHNKKLLAKIPPIYVPLGGKTKVQHGTYYQVFTGPGTVFEGNKRIGFTDVPDGTSNTIMIVEAGEAVPWTKPADLPYNPGKDLPKLGGLFPAGFNVAMCDGSVRWVPRRFNRANFRIAIMRNDGIVSSGDFSSDR